VDQAFQRDPGLGRSVVGTEVEADRSQLDHAVREVAGRLAIQRHETEVGQLRVPRGSFGQLAIPKRSQSGRVVEGRALRRGRSQARYQVLPRSCETALATSP
jgi:hypothetical protein